jgi:guanosine-3',5'-bis(diphosphate) 3'-pyrophosphohydrolase
MSRDLSRILLAASFSARKHRNQRRKDAEESPYVNHAIEVATVLAVEGGVTDVDLLVAALLHDTVEDTQTTLEEVATHFGDDVKGIVGEVTDDKSLPKQRRKQLQVETAAHKSARAKELKIADKICNVRDIDRDSPANWDTARKIQYMKWATAVVDGCRGVNPQLEALFDELVVSVRQRLSTLHE